MTQSGMEQAFEQVDAELCGRLWCSWWCITPDVMRLWPGSCRAGAGEPTASASLCARQG
ncbi:MAG: hypothetical protein ACLUD2_09205 [Clostridium sp.]